MKTLILASCFLLIAGCANDASLGYSVAKVRQEQTFDLRATERNKGVVPTGTGARMQVAYDDYVNQSAYDGEAEKVLSKGLIQRSITND